MQYTIFICLCNDSPYMARNRVPRSITLPQDLDDWVQSKIKTKDFANFTHAVEKGIILLKAKMESKK